MSNSLYRKQQQNLQQSNTNDLEEDWSSLFNNSDVGLLPSYDEMEILLLPDQNVKLKLKCLTEQRLSPLDIVNSHSAGDHDATGHHVWLASYFFLDVIVRPFDSESSNLQKVRKELFSSKRVLELGCGTGIAGLAVMVGLTKYVSKQRGDRVLPSELFMTDADPDALELCAENCELNNFSERDDSIFVSQLSWGTDWWCDEESAGKGKLTKESFDTVFAADVVYDLNVLPLLMKTVCEALSPNGNFALSHVPRFASSSVESLIIEEANKVGLYLDQKWYPRDIYKKSEDVMATLEKFEEKNAVFFLFVKQSCC